MADKLKILLALLLVAAGLAGFYFLGGQPLILRVLSVLAGIGAGAALAWFTAGGQGFFSFANEAVTETKKVVWPTRKETIQTTAIVFGFVLAMAVMLYLTDKTLEWFLYDVVLGWKKS